MLRSKAGCACISHRAALECCEYMILSSLHTAEKAFVQAFHVPQNAWGSQSTF